MEATVSHRAQTLILTGLIMLTKMRFTDDINIIITLFSCILVLVMIFSMPIMFSVQIALSDNLGVLTKMTVIGIGNRLSESVIEIGYRLSESVIGNRLSDSAKRDVIVQFPLIAYGRMFTPDWADVLNFHIICCCMIRPVSQCGNCYLFPIKGTGRMVYFTIL
jgi:hypothetical protein